MDRAKDEQQKRQLDEQGSEAEDTLSCAACGALNEPEARYCCECGTSIHSAGQCPRCGASILPGGDICEVCGEWLLPDKCKFCYAPIEEEAKFCAECGNPVDGIQCPKCSKLSYFDFCKHCGIPLTAQSQEMIRELQDAEEFKALLQNIQTISQPATPVPDEADLQELMRMKQYEKKFKKIEKSQAPQQTFRLGNVEETIELAKKTKESEQKTASPSDLTASLQKLQQKTFKTNQEARRFFGALKVLLPTMVKVPVPIGWRCNAFNCFHPDGPQGCADPGPGGEWIFEERSEIKIKEAQI